MRAGEAVVMRSLKDLTQLLAQPDVRRTARARGLIARAFLAVEAVAADAVIGASEHVRLSVAILLLVLFGEDGWVRRLHMQTAVSVAEPVQNGPACVHRSDVRGHECGIKVLLLLFDPPRVSGSAAAAAAAAPSVAAALKRSASAPSQLTQKALRESLVAAMRRRDGDGLATMSAVRACGQGKQHSVALCAGRDEDVFPRAACDAAEMCGQRNSGRRSVASPC